MLVFLKTLVSSASQQPGLIQPGLGRPGGGGGSGGQAEGRGRAGSLAASSESFPGHPEVLGPDMALESRGWGALEPPRLDQFHRNTAIGRSWPPSADRDKRGGKG